MKLTGGIGGWGGERLGGVHGSLVGYVSQHCAYVKASYRLITFA